MDIHTGFSADLSAAQDLSRALSRYNINAAHGFLPLNPTTALPYGFKVFDQAGLALPSLLRGGMLENAVKELPILNINDINGLLLDETMLLKTRLDFLIHGYVWEKWNEGKVRLEIPANLAVPARSVSYRLGLPPLLCYSSYALWNWERKDPDGPIIPENLKLIQNFLGGESEEWFVVIHVAIEYAAGSLIRACWLMGDALTAKNEALVSRYLQDIATSLEQINAVMRRMPEHCDPREYFTKVRPYLYGWDKKEIFPKGILYKGETKSKDEYLTFPGETGAQSSIFPSLDRVMGIRHSSDDLSRHLHVMLYDCTPLHHREFVLALEKRPALSEENISSYTADTGELYWKCRELMKEFRTIHLGYAADYIQKQARGVQKNLEYLGVEGSGGTMYMPSLAKHIKETDKK
jgi:indoleamine 2,3-dioxygenase